MALLGVGEILEDSDFSNTFTLIRRQQVVNQYGEGEKVEISRTTEIGSVQPAGSSSKNIVTTPDGERVLWDLMIYTRAAMTTGNAQGRVADLVIFNGNTYEVAATSDYSHFTPGHVEVYLKTHNTRPEN